METRLHTSKPWCILFVKFIRIIIVSIVCIISNPVLSDSNLNLPDIGDSTGTFMSPELEKRLGQAFLNQVRKQAKIDSDPEVETYIQSIGYRLVSQSDNNTQAFTFFVVDDPQINAFAAPGGIVGVNSGVILNADTESELAAVMAHEISHVTQRHMARSMEMQQHMSLPMMAAMLGAILIATQNPEAGQAAMMAIQGGAAQAQINFTRENEAEADRMGMKLLARSHFNPQGMPEFFEKLQKNSRYASQAPEFLRDHPLTNKRISDTEARADAYPADFKYHESRSFPFIKAKVIVMSYQDPNDAVKYFRDRVKNEKFTNEYESLRYGYALALTAAENYAQASEQLQALLKKEPENPAFLIAAANLETKRGNYPQAYGYYDRAIKIYPDFRPVVLTYTRTLLENNDPQKALKILKNYEKYKEPDLTYYQYLTRAEGESGHTIEASMASAEYYYLSGETGLAIQQLQALLNQRSPVPDSFQQERIHDRLAFFERELKIEKDMKLIK